MQEQVLAGQAGAKTNWFHLQTRRVWNPALQHFAAIKSMFGAQDWHVCTNKCLSDCSLYLMTSQAVTQAITILKSYILYQSRSYKL